MRTPRALTWRWVWEGAHRRRLRHRLLRASRRSQQHAIGLTAAIGVEREGKRSEEKKNRKRCVYFVTLHKRGEGEVEGGREGGREGKGKDVMRASHWGSDSQSFCSPFPPAREHPERTILRHILDTRTPFPTPKYASMFRKAIIQMQGNIFYFIFLIRFLLILIFNFFKCEHIFYFIVLIRFLLIFIFIF